MNTVLLPPNVRSTTLNSRQPLHSQSRRRRSQDWCIPASHSANVVQLGLQGPLPGKEDKSVFTAHWFPGHGCRDVNKVPIVAGLALRSILFSAETQFVKAAG